MCWPGWREQEQGGPGREALGIQARPPESTGGRGEHRPRVAVWPEPRPPLLWSGHRDSARPAGLSEGSGRPARSSAEHSAGTLLWPLLVAATAGHRGGAAWGAVSPQPRRASSLLTVWAGPSCPRRTPLAAAAAGGPVLPCPPHRPARARPAPATQAKESRSRGSPLESGGAADIPGDPGLGPRRPWPSAARSRDGGRPHGPSPAFSRLPQKRGA